MGAMSWVEMIRVRSSEPALKQALPQLEAYAAALESELKGAEFFFLQHALYNGDLAVVVIWKEETEVEKSQAGLLLAEQLQQLGTIEHAVWLPTFSESYQKPD
jgi:hypothetical protein